METPHRYHVCILLSNVDFDILLVIGVLPHLIGYLLTYDLTVAQSSVK